MWQPLAVSGAVVAGSLPGGVAVDNQGSASYGIPIEVVPGTGGLQPDLALHYNSRSANGMVGVGWSVAGLSTIARGPTTDFLETTNRANYDPENYKIHGVDFTNYDRFYLDGQKLVAISGSYGANNAVYRTFMDSFARVSSHGSAGGGPAYFVVRTKDGLYMEYGNSSDSRIEAQGKSQVMFWALNKVQDTSGNTMTFHYTETNSAGEYRIDRIDYSFDGTNYDANRVQFVYETATRPDVILGYLKGSKMSLSKRLAKIVVKEGSTIIREYRLAYGQGTSSKRSRLTSVTLHAGSDNLPATLFSWQDRSDHGYDDESFASTGDDIGSWSSSAGVIGEVKAIDINGDGRLEILKEVYKGSNAKAEVWKYTPSAAGSSNIGSLSLQSTKSGLLGDPDMTYWEVGDIDGDGWTDLILHEFDEDTENCYYWEDPAELICDYYEKIHVYQSNGTGFDGPFTVTGDSFYSYDEYNTRLTELNAIDFNGDARTDLITLDSSISGKIVYDLYRSERSASSGSLVRVVNEGELAVPTNASQFTYSPIDFNGDGMGDMLITFKTGNLRKARIYLSDGTDFASSYIEQSFGNHLNNSVEAIEVNGDGLTDLIRHYKSGSNAKVKVYLSKGNSLVASGQEASYAWNSDRRLFPMEINGDGRADLLIIDKNGSNARGRVWLSRGTDLGNGAPLVTFALGTWANAHKYIPFDLDVDGKGDLLKIYKSGTAAQVDPWLSKGEVPDLMTVVTNGLGAKTKIEYSSLIRDENYTSGLDQNPVVLPSYPILQFHGSPLQVVSAVKRDDGRGAANTNYESTYAYGEGNLQLWGDGFLGFRTFTSYDSQRKVYKIETVSQSFPYTGMVESSLTYVYDTRATNNLALVSKTENSELDKKTLHSGKTYFPYIKRSEEERYEIPETGSLPTTYYQKTSTTNAFDSYGNNTRIVIDYNYGGNAGNVTDTTVNTYNNSSTFINPSVGKWILGRLTAATVTAKVGSSTQSRSSSFAYDTTTGLLKKETIQPSHATLKLITDYARDGYGNVTSTTVSGPGITTRSSSSTYDSSKRYVVSATNALGHTATSQYNKAGYGVVTRTTDPNSLSVNWQYDAFGRPTLSTRPDGTKTRTTRYKASELPSGAPAHAAYAVKTELLGAGGQIAAPVTVFYDRQGRKMRSMTLTAAGSTVYKDTVYNAEGRLEKASDNYLSTSSPYWTLSVYDSVGRPKYTKVQKVAAATTDAHYIITKFEYDGLESTVISDWDSAGSNLNQSTTSTRDVKGQTVTVEDADSNTISYSYDPFGNLLSTTDPDGNAITMSYDIRGHKIAMSDPDMGSWSYAYNTLGELTSQTDAKSTQTSFVYDKLGRVTSRTITPSSGDPLSYSWSYDTAAKGIGAIASESGPHGYSRSYTYDSLGRPKSTTRTINGSSYTQIIGYDAYSRVKSITYPGDFFITNTYNDKGYITEVEDSTGHTWWENPSYDTYGRATSYQYGNAVVTNLTYERGTEFLTSILAGTAGSPPDNIQHLSYSYDHLGNLTEREDSTDASNTLTETFEYDDLNRLTQSQVSGLSARTVTYNSLGNILTKDGVSYTYSASKPHAVSQAGTVDYSYDANGNVTQRGDNSVW